MTNQNQVTDTDIAKLLRLLDKVNAAEADLQTAGYGNGLDRAKLFSKYTRDAIASIIHNQHALKNDIERIKKLLNSSISNTNLGEANESVQRESTSQNQYRQV